MRNPRDGRYYALASKNGAREAFLLRARSIEGPFQEGPVIGQGMRHFDLHFSDDGVMMVFFSMVGDRPERILLGTIDTTLTDNWND